MNGLTIFIYLANVLPHLAILFGAGAIIIGVATFIYTIINLMHNSDLEEFPSLYPKKAKKRSIKYTKFGVIAIVILALFSASIPDKTTMYLMAGSEAGEYVVNTEQGKEILDEIQKAIKVQLENLQKTEDQ